MTTLRPWSEADFDMLERCNTPEMTMHLGGPESSAQLRDRQRRYVENAFHGQMFIVLTPANEPAGSIGFWEHVEDNGSTVWAAGWAIAPEFQGRGLAAEALSELLKVASAEASHHWLHAYPGVTNAASNALCRKAGFELVRELEFEYPTGHWMRCNDWRADLGVIVSS